MRIALVSPYLWTIHGGVNDHVANLAAELERRGHEPWIIAPSGGVHANGKEVPLPERFLSGGMAFPLRSNGSTAYVNFSPLMPWRLQRLLLEHKFDLIHAHEPCVPSAPGSAVLVSEVPAVGTFHAAGTRSLPYMMLASAASLVIDRLAARIAVSDAARDFVSRYFPGDYRIIPNGVVPEAYEAARRGPKVGGRLLFIGRAEPRKGLLVLLRALQMVRRHLPWVSLSVIGTDEAELRTLVSRASSGLTWPLPGVTAMGRVSQAEKVQALREAELMVVPSIQGESFGVVLIEALAAGVPVVASDLSAYRSVLRDGELGGLVRPGDANALAGTLEAILGDQRLRQQMADRGLLAVREFAWSSITDRVLEVYEQAMDAGAPRRPVASGGRLRNGSLTAALRRR